MKRILGAGLVVLTAAAIITGCSHPTSNTTSTSGSGSPPGRRHRRHHRVRSGIAEIDVHRTRLTI